MPTIYDEKNDVIISTNPYRRKGLMYIATFTVHYPNGYEHKITYKLDFISYHLIKLIHGESKLLEMSRPC